MEEAVGDVEGWIRRVLAAVAFSDGTTHLVLDFDELLQRLCALVPRPRGHRVRYHGVLAPAARHRKRVVPCQDVGGSELVTEGATLELVAASEDELDYSFGPGRASLEKPARRGRVRRMLWAELLRRVFEIDALKCSRCGGRMRVIATIIEAKVVTAILESLGLPSDHPALRPSRGPPEAEMVEYSWC